MHHYALRCDHRRRHRKTLRLAQHGAAGAKVGALQDRWAWVTH